MVAAPCFVEANSASSWIANGCGFQPVRQLSFRCSARCAAWEKYVMAMVCDPLICA